MTFSNTSDLGKNVILILLSNITSDRKSCIFQYDPHYSFVIYNTIIVALNLFFYVLNCFVLLVKVWHTHQKNGYHKQIYDKTNMSFLDLLIFWVGLETILITM